MTIDEYVKKNNLPKMELIGEMKNFRYYMEADLDPENEVGIPDIISENKITGEFALCSSDQALSLLAYF